MDERIERAASAYHQAVFGGDPSELAAAERGLDAVEADLALARGRILHARYLAARTADPEELALFQRAAEGFQRLGDLRGEAEAVFLVAIYHQVVRREDPVAVPLFERALDLATEAGDRLIQSYALRHLGIAEQAAGRLELARQRLLESTRLRRELGFTAGVAANLVGLAYIAASDGRRDDALALLTEADGLAAASGAAGIQRQIDEARIGL